MEKSGKGNTYTEAKRKYSHSEKGKEYKRKYDKTQKRIAYRRAYQKTPQRQAYLKKYSSSEKRKEYMRVWQKKYREKNVEKRRIYNSNPRVLFRQYLHGAKRHNRTFNISFDTFLKIISESCFYCGKSANPRNGIDRKDNNIGYELFNCVSCCSLCNSMKLTRSPDDFIKKCIEIVEHQKRMRLP